MRLVVGTLVCLVPVCALGEVKLREGIVYVKQGEREVKADIYIPEGKGPHPAVLVVHGGAWALGNRKQMARHARHFAKNGFLAMSIDYRLAPKWKFPAQIHDCKAAVRYLRENAKELNIDPKRIAGYGYSAGGHLVALLGTSDPNDKLEGTKKKGVSTRLQAVVAGGAPVDFTVLPRNSKSLTYWLKSTRAEDPAIYKLASPLSFATKDDPPMLFFHGEKDKLVPILSPRVMVKKLTDLKIKSELVVVKNKEHLGAFASPESFDAGVRFLRDVFKLK